MSSGIRIGTRGSKLAVAQANWVAMKLKEATGVEAELVVITTTGDAEGWQSRRRIGGKGDFVKEIQAALLGGEIDLALHSLKDLPAREPEKLCIAAIPPRADPSDALVSLDGADLAGLPPGAVIGTSSLRRRAQILNFRPDLVIQEMRGNLDTRLRKLEEGACHALIVAAAGMERLGMERRITERIPFEICLPAPGQGAIAVEAREVDRPFGPPPFDKLRVSPRLDGATPSVAEGPRRPDVSGLADDAQTLALARAIDDPAAHAEARAERALVEALGADCQVPLGALARWAPGRLTLQAVVAAPDGKNLARARVEGDSNNPEQLGRKAAEQLRAAGAEEILRRLIPQAGCQGRSAPDVS
jgi:hydroxymethylbilane synthase